MTAPALTEPPAPATPTAYRACWFPASVRRPDGGLIPVAKVYATAAGLFVYATPPPLADRATGGTPKYHVGIDYDKTPPPLTGYAARQKGVKLITADGEVVRVQPLAACSCSYADLRDWRPTWANRSEAWK